MIKDNENCIQNLKDFMKLWLGKTLPEYGLSKSEVPDYMPKPLRELYLFCGNWPHPVEDVDNPETIDLEDKQPGIFQHGQDILMGVNNIERNNGRLTFLFENQGNWTCEVEENNDDSPVYSDAATVWDENATGQEIVSRSLANFLVTFCLQELVYNSKFMGTLDDKLKKESTLKKSDPLWLNGFYVDKEPNRSFYLIEKKILIMDEYWFGCNDESVLSFYGLTNNIR